MFCAEEAVVVTTASTVLDPTLTCSNDDGSSSSCSLTVSAFGDLELLPPVGDDTLRKGAGGGVAHTGGNWPLHTCFTEPGNACCLFTPLAAREKNPEAAVLSPELAFSLFLLANL